MNTKQFPILLKREFWENRGGFLRAPVTVSIVFAAITLMAWIWAEVTVGRTGIKIDNLPLETIAAQAGDHMDDIGIFFNGGMVVLSMVMQMVLAVVLFFYLLGALYDDRRDRSVLFWKSMPVSDTATVASKIVSAVIVAPVLAFGATVLLHLSLLAILSLMLMFHGLNPMTLVWGPAEPLRIWVQLLLTIPVHALWVLPTVGWLLLVSSFARSKPILWAILPPMAVGLLLGWFQVLRTFAIPSSWYWQHVFGRILASFLPGSWGNDGLGLQFGLNISHKSDITQVMSWEVLGNALANPELWAGVVAGAAMIAGSVYFRSTRELAD